MFVKWIGKMARNNTFGVFPPGEPVEVPRHIGQQLLKNPRFVELTIAEEHLLASGDEAALRRRLQLAADELSQMSAEIDKLSTANAQLEAELVKYREAEALGPAPSAEDLNESETGEGSEEDIRVNEP
ncbi:MAG: hypothetical protein M0R74_20160 [Dehalococcoidia bacterium]|nr:hypothetical protein [Dehalococcoidia bacterium]